MLWTTITILCLAWLFLFSPEAKRKRAGKSKSSGQPSAYRPIESIPSGARDGLLCWRWKIKLGKNDDDISRYLSKWRYPDDFVTSLVLEEICDGSTYKGECRQIHDEDEKRISEVVISLSKTGPPSAIKKMSSLSRRERRDLVLSLIRKAMSGDRMPTEVSHA